MFRWLKSRRQEFVDDRVAVSLKSQLPSLIENQIRELLMLTKENAEPNINNLWLVAKDIDLIKLNIKFYGYEMAQALAAALPPREGLAARRVDLQSKASTQEDLESDWAAYWAAELKVPVIFHRKLWELVYVLQGLWETNCLQSGTKGIGFGCGMEPLPSYFASKGISVVVTDLPPDDRATRGWQDANQHAGTLDQVFQPQLVGLKTFQELVKLEYVDMNAIPKHLRDFDFCWSVCAMEHLGSISNGIRFVERALDVLRPGGVAIHTTEFNFANDSETVDNWPTVLFQRKHLLGLAESLQRDGHAVASLNFSVGDRLLDRFIDLPPFAHEMSSHPSVDWIPGPSHLKLAIDGFASTCFGLIIRKSCA
jgi:SAM-dependent methyltransferase